MQEPQMEGTPSSPPYTHTYSGTPSSHTAPPGAGTPASGYTPPSQVYGQPTYLPPVSTTQGLSDTAAGTIAYLTIIPAIVFLVLAPYSSRPFVKFHAIQCLGLMVAWFCLGVVGIVPLLGWLVAICGVFILLAVWILSMVKASQGTYLKLPIISSFASRQSGFPIA